MAKPVRASYRGLKICPNCGHVQAQRKLICGNESCSLRQKILATQIPYDPIRLVSKTSTTTFYSLRSKEREIPRNFIETAEIVVTLDHGSSIVSKNSICYVETCKYDVKAAANFTCRHIKACYADSTKSIPNAEVYPIAREVLWNLNIDSNQKQRLWDDYVEDESFVPAIQRLSSTTFAVKCIKSKIFPAGRLHVTALSNVTGSPKKTSYACACKKLKIILEPDNSVVMQEEICDHLLLVLSAVLSKPNGKQMYKSFINALKQFWMPTQLEKPLSIQEDSFFGLDINIGGNFGEAENDTISSDDIFIFDDKFLTDDSFPDLTDIVLDLTPADLLSPQQDQTTQSTTNTNSSAPLLLHAGDPNLVSSCNINEEDIDIRFDDIALATQTKSATDQLITANTIIDEVHIDATQLELSDCNIELMDQFQLTDRIDLCSEEIDLQGTSTSLFGNETNSINILSPAENTLTQSTRPLVPITISLPQSSNSLPCYEQTANPQIQTNTTNGIANSNSLLKTSHNILPPTTLEAPPIELPTITVVKKTPVKATQIVTEVKTRKFPHIPAKRALIVNTPLEQLSQDSTKNVATVEIEPSLAYSAWLEYIIEVINDSIEISEHTQVTHTFHVHEEIFSHFSKSFSVGIKRRMPNSTTIVKSGKHKGLIRYIWYFPTAATVRRIFSTKNISLQVERAFEKTGDDDFVPYVRTVPCDMNSDTKKRRIYPKLSLYMAHIWFDCNSEDHKAGFKIEWLPNAFPKSHFGILKIEFSLGIKDPYNLGFN